MPPNPPDVSDRHRPPDNHCGDPSLPFPAPTTSPAIPHEYHIRLCLPRSTDIPLSMDTFPRRASPTARHRDSDVPRHPSHALRSLNITCPALAPGC